MSQLENAGSFSQHTQAEHVEKQNIMNPLFVELKYLQGQKKLYWIEKARWIKLEENVEEGSRRWSIPFVPSLSYQALMNLKDCLEKGAVILDAKTCNLSEIAMLIVNTLMDLQVLSSGDKELLHSTLLARHLHQHQVSNSRFNMKRPPRRLSAYIEEKMEGLADIEQRDKDNKLAQPSSDKVNNQDNKRKSLLEKSSSPNTEVCSILTAFLPYLAHPCAIFLRLEPSCMLKDMTELTFPVRFITLLVGPYEEKVDYFQSGRCVGALMSDTVFKQLAYVAKTKEELLSGIDQFLKTTVLLQPGVWDQKTLQQSVRIIERQSRPNNSERCETIHDWEEEKNKLDNQQFEDTLARTGRFCGGFIKDIKRKGPYYLSDFTEGLNFRCIVAIFLIYFAALAPAITFGAVLSNHTKELLGVHQMVLATGLAGILFGLFAGQPLIILGPTGPLLVMEQSIYDLTISLKVEFLPWRAWIGIWVFLTCFFLVVFDLSFLIRCFTRFTEEIFAFLVSTIFIYQAFTYGIQMYNKYPFAKALNLSSLNATKSLSKDVHFESAHPNKGLLSVMLMLLTFSMSYMLRKFRHSRFFSLFARRLLSDFGILMAVLLIVSFDLIICDNISDKLQKSGKFTTIFQDRDWLINLRGSKIELSVQMIFLAALPALLLSVLVFMETQITGMIMDKRSNKLIKGCGYHLDLFVVSFIVLICAILGLPFMCASPVHSLSHLNALSVYSTDHPPGTKEQLLKVNEQRVTNILMHFLVGISVFLAPMLRLIPVSVLYGVLLYLGIISVTHLQLFQRVQMLFIPSKRHPDTIYVRRVATSRIHLYTFIQILCFGVLVFVKTSVIAPAFPLFILCTVPIRSFLGKTFTEDELESLDNEEDEEDYLDEYEAVHVPI